MLLKIQMARRGGEDNGWNVEDIGNATERSNRCAREARGQQPKKQARVAAEERSSRRSGTALQQKRQQPKKPRV